MTRAEDVAWAAGLFEGEGCWFLQDKLGSMRSRAVLAMTDEDAVRRFADIVGVGAVRPRPTKNPRHKDAWYWFTDSASDFVCVGTLLGPYMCERRLAKLISALEAIPQPSSSRWCWAKYD
jgi:hypothetical protein